MHPQEIEKKAKIKYWLEVSGMGRKELAQKLSVSDNALNGWLSTRDIPPARWQEIKAIFEPEDIPPEPRNKILGGNFTATEVESVLKAANGKEMSEFIRELVLRQVKQDIENASVNQSPQ